MLCICERDFPCFCLRLLYFDACDPEPPPTAAFLDIKSLTDLYIQALLARMGLRMAMRRTGWALYVSQLAGRRINVGGMNAGLVGTVKLVLALTRDRCRSQYVVGCFFDPGYRRQCRTARDSEWGVPRLVLKQEGQNIRIYDLIYM